MEQSKVKAAVVAGWLGNEGSTGDIEMMECLGVFDDVLAAYGKAYLYLDELAASYEHECTITPLSELEGETGFGMWLKDKEGRSKFYAFVLTVQPEQGEVIR